LPGVWGWYVATGQESLTLKGHTRDVTDVAFRTDGKRLASASDDKSVKVWDLATGRNLLTLKGHTIDVVSVVFAPNGHRLESASNDKTVKIWDITPQQ
jgi:WD40 repeat protein